MPAGARCADDYLGIVVVWLFLEVLFDADGLLLELKGVQQLPAFRNPLFASANIGEVPRPPIIEPAPPTSPHPCSTER